jgi:crossover junction endodeoxyribonuclease RuvC
MRILAIDTSMTAPGVAVLEVKNRKASVVDVSHVVTSSKDNHGLRAEIIDAWLTLFIAKHIQRGKPNGGFAVVLREDFNGRTSRQSHPVFSAWGVCDRVLNKFAIEFTTQAISQSKVKKLVVGKGKAEKDEVEAAVRKWTGYKGEFVKDDESDSCAIGLAYLIEEGLIDEKS